MSLPGQVVDERRLRDVASEGDARTSGLSSVSRWRPCGCGRRRDTPAMPTNFAGSVFAAARLSQLIPGGAHTYAKGPDQYPADCPVVIEGSSHLSVG